MTFFLSAFVFPVLAVAVLFGLGALVAAFSDRPVTKDQLMREAY